MTHAFTQKLGACGVVLAVMLTTCTPSFAAEPPPTGRAPATLLASAQQQVQQLAATLPKALPRPALQQGTGGSGYDEPGTFFTTKRGVALLVLAGAGIGYMWYSKVHDRIHSVARERLDE